MDYEWGIMNEVNLEFWETFLNSPKTHFFLTKAKNVSSVQIRVDF